MYTPTAIHASHETCAISLHSSSNKCTFYGFCVDFDDMHTYIAFEGGGGIIKDANNVRPLVRRQQWSERNRNRSTSNTISLVNYEWATRNRELLLNNIICCILCASCHVFDGRHAIRRLTKANLHTGRHASVHFIIRSHHLGHVDIWTKRMSKMNNM